MSFKYPTLERIIEYNLLALELIKAKKADQPKVLSLPKIKEVLEACENNKGDIYDKGVILLKGLVQKHAFANGNRRTAFIALKDFMRRNRVKCMVLNEPISARVMLGIREGYYSDEEIKEWIQNGKIREFKRQN